MLRIRHEIALDAIVQHAGFIIRLSIVGLGHRGEDRSVINMSARSAKGLAIAELCVMKIRHDVEVELRCTYL